MGKLHRMSNHTNPFRDTCSAAFCLGAAAELGEEGILSSELLAVVLPSPCLVLLLWLLLQLSLWQLLPSPCASAPPPPSSNLLRKSCRIRNSVPSHLVKPLLFSIPGPRASQLLSAGALEAHLGSYWIRSVLLLLLQL